MSGDDGINVGCTEKFSELCALSTTSSLTSEERWRLEQHVLVCPSCASLLADYHSLTSAGMARLGAARDFKESESTRDLPWDRESARLRLRSILARSPGDSKHAAKQRGFFAIVGWSRMTSFAGVAAVVLFVALLGYEQGLKRGIERAPSIPQESPTDPPLRQQLSDVPTQRAALEQKLAADSKAAAALADRATKAEKHLAELQTLKTSLEAKAQELGSENQQQSASLAALSTEHEALQQKLRDTENTLQKVRQEERQKALLRSTNLETQVDRLSAQLREREATAQRQDQYLASDRDVRELMGARQLYIADVFDVDPQGKTRNPFGRVFYTRGKSLIFYAFDLDREPGYREAKAFQAWGRPGSSQTTPVSLGIFYMDNESNRRWALKFDDPKVLDEINAVFVTVEPKGGSKKPTNKPFLLAYLHTAPPNHP